jgi:ATP-dependent Clp protease protease subunit
MYKRKFPNNIQFGPKFNKNKKTKKNDDNESSSSDSVDLSSLGNELIDKLSKKNSESKIERDCNHIYFYSEVDRESIYDLCSLIKEAEEENIITSYKLDIEQVPIYLHINSMGGCVFSAFNVIDCINSCKVPIYTIIEGSTASAGTLISVVGKKRYIRPNAFMLIHQLSSFFGGKMSEIEDEYKNLQELMIKIKDVYKDHSKIPRKELNDLLKHDLWLNSNKCLQYGLVDELWTK